MPAPGPARIHFARQVHLEDAAAEQLARTYTVVWQVRLEEWDAWIDYARNLCERIEAAWHAMATIIVLGPDSDPEKWEVNLQRFTQTNQGSGTLRSIRRVLVTNR